MQVLNQAGWLRTTKSPTLRPTPSTRRPPAQGPQFEAGTQGQAQAQQPAALRLLEGNRKQEAASKWTTYPGNLEIPRGWRSNEGGATSETRASCKGAVVVSPDANAAPESGSVVHYLPTVATVKCCHHPITGKKTDLKALLPAAMVFFTLIAMPEIKHHGMATANFVTHPLSLIR